MKVFLSYSQSDKKWADYLRKSLPAHFSESSGLNEIELWDPAKELEPGANWRLESGKALQNADAMLVLLSPDSVKSEYVQSEIDYALASPQFRGRVISLLLKPTKDVPWILRNQPFIEVSAEREATVTRVAGALKSVAHATP